MDSAPAPSQRATPARPSFEVAATQLVCTSSPTPTATARELRVVGPGGTLAACVCDFDQGIIRKRGNN